MAVEFDPTKNATNIAKHGVSLSEGDGVLNDPLGRTIEDTSSEGEQRWQTVGVNIFGVPYVVVWTKCQGRERIVSVRKPDSQERKAYETKR